MRVLAPIKVSILARLFGLRLNIHTTLRQIAAVCVGFNRHPLRLPDECLSKTVARVSAAVNFYPHAGRFETRRQSYGFVIILEVSEGVCQADASTRRQFRETEAPRLAVQQAVDHERGVARHRALRDRKSVV